MNSGRDYRVEEAGAVEMEPQVVCLGGIDHPPEPIEWKEATTSGVVRVLDSHQRDRRAMVIARRNRGDDVLAVEETIVADGLDLHSRQSSRSS